MIDVFVLNKIKALDKDNKIDIKIQDDDIVFNNIYSLTCNKYLDFTSANFGEYTEFRFEAFDDDSIVDDFDLILDTTNFLKENREKILKILSEVDND